LRTIDSRLTREVVDEIRRKPKSGSERAPRLVSSSGGRSAKWSSGLPA